MLGSGIIDIDKASFVGEWATLDEWMRAHLGCRMEEVEVPLDLILAASTCECGRVAFYRDEIVLKETLHAALLSQSVKLLAVFWYAKHDGESGGESDVGFGDVTLRIVKTRLSPLIQRQPHDLLRSTCAFDGPGGMGKDRIAALEVGNVGPDFVASVVAEDRLHIRVWICECLWKAPDSAGVKGDARCYNELIVGEFLAAGERDSILSGHEAGHAVVVELELGVDQALQWSSQVLFLLQTTTNKGPSRLVVVPLVWIHGRDVILGESAGPEKLMADIQSSAAASDDESLVMPRRRYDGVCV